MPYPKAWVKTIAHFNFFVRLWLLSQLGLIEAYGKQLEMEMEIFSCKKRIYSIVYLTTHLLPGFGLRGMPFSYNPLKVK